MNGPGGGSESIATIASSTSGSSQSSSKVLSHCPTSTVSRPEMSSRSSIAGTRPAQFRIVPPAYIELSGRTAWKPAGVC